MGPGRRQHFLLEPQPLHKALLRPLLNTFLLEQSRTIQATYHSCSIQSAFALLCSAFLSPTNYRLY